MGRELHVVSHPSRVEHWRHLVEIVALIIAAVWGFYVFAYQERIKPALERPNFQQKVTVHHERLSAQKEYVEVEIDFNNVSGTPTSLNGINLNIYGRSMAATSARQIETPVPGLAELNNTLTLSTPKLLYSFYDTWKAFGAPAKVNVVAPGHDFRERIAFGIKPGEYDMLRITYLFCFSRPTDERWAVRRQQDPDGSWHFGGIDVTNTPNLTCSGQRRGEYFPL